MGKISIVLYIVYLEYIQAQRACIKPTAVAKLHASGVIHVESL